MKKKSSTCIRSMAYIPDENLTRRKNSTISQLINNTKIQKQFNVLPPNNSGFFLMVLPSACFWHNKWDLGWLWARPWSGQEQTAGSWADWSLWPVSDYRWSSHTLLDQSESLLSSTAELHSVASPTLHVF